MLFTQLNDLTFLFPNQAILLIFEKHIRSYAFQEIITEKMIFYQYLCSHIF